MTTATTRRLTVTCSGPDPALSPNARVHWAKLRKAKAAARREARALTWKAFVDVDDGGDITGVTIRRTFYRPTKRVADIDNLEASTKSMADGIADALGVNDRLFRWLPSEVVVERGRREVTFEIELEVGAAQ